MLKAIRKRLSLKIFLSYLIVIAVGMAIVASTANLAVPSAFEHHMAGMGVSMQGMMGGNGGRGQGIYQSFRAAVSEALGWAVLAAVLAAVIASWFVSRQVVIPIQHMMQASQRIADGHYEERVPVPGNIQKDELDELSQLALRFNQMAARLDQTETMRRQLIGDVAHELRTPLTMVKGTIEGLMDGVLPADDETYQQMHQEIDRLQRLVADLQELSRFESGAVPLNFHEVPVDRLVKKVADRLGRLYVDKGVTLKTILPGDIPAAWADEDRLVQVLVNLVGNALAYTPAGGEVAITASRQEKAVLLAVKDNGIGIPAEHLPHVFTRFYRVDKSRSRASGGSGIGLTIARSIVEAHGGRIWVESEGSGKGSTFYFTIPVAAG